MTAVIFTHSNSFGPIRSERRIDPHVKTSSTCGSAWLPKHWSPKRDADEAARIREELKFLKQMEEAGYGYYL